MSYFDFPRIRVSGAIVINVGTGNNNGPGPDQIPSNEYGYKIANSKDVQIENPPKVYNAQGEAPVPFLPKLTSDQYANWLKSYNDQVGPAMWNYYGDMAFWMYDVKVNGIKISTTQTGNYPDGDNSIINTFKDAKLRFAAPNTISSPDGEYIDTFGKFSGGVICDVQPEASPPGSQIFADNLILFKDNQVLFSRSIDENTGDYKPGSPLSKGSSCFAGATYINSPKGPSGAGTGFFQQRIPFSNGFDGTGINELFNQYVSPEKAATIKGIVFRYQLYTGSTFSYQNGVGAPMSCLITGYIAPWYDTDDELDTVTMGRLLTSSPPQKAGNTALVKVHSNFVSLDILNAFAPGPIAPSNTGLYYGSSSSDLTEIGTFNFYDTLESISINLDKTRRFSTGSLTGAASNSQELTRGPKDLIFDFPISSTLSDEINSNSGKFYLKNNGTIILEEQEYMIAAKQPSVYAEQAILAEPTLIDTFRFDGPDKVTCQFHVRRKGMPITDGTDKFDLYQYRTTPIAASEYLGTIENFNPLTDNIEVDVTQAGNQRFILVPKNASFFPPTSTPTDPNSKTIIDFIANPNTGSNYLCFQVRVLPNADYSEYYTKTAEGELIATDQLNYQVIFNEVFENYFVLYPSMSKEVSMGHNSNHWSNPSMARKLLERISINDFNSFAFMPRTRDVSRSRRELMEAWALKVIRNGGDTSAPTA